MAHTDSLICRKFIDNKKVSAKVSLRGLRRLTWTDTFFFLFLFGRCIKPPFHRACLEHFISRVFFFTPPTPVRKSNLNYMVHGEIFGNLSSVNHPLTPYHRIFILTSTDLTLHLVLHL